MNRNLSLYDKSPYSDKANIQLIQRGEYEIRDHATGVVLFKGHNKVIIPGSQFTACKHFNLNRTVNYKSYNDLLSLTDPTGTIFTDAMYRASTVCLFAVGTDGCGAEQSQVYDVDYTKIIGVDSLVPFRYQNILPNVDTGNNDLTGDMRDKYFGRKILGASNDTAAYYFKAFDTTPELKIQYLDGTPVDENIYQSLNSNEAETFIELKMSITKEDCRDFFIATTGINTAKVNTISLLTAYPVNGDDGYTYYQGILPLTKLNFPSIPLIDTTLGIDITYHIYY